MEPEGATPPSQSAPPPPIDTNSTSNTPTDEPVGSELFCHVDVLPTNGESQETTATISYPLPCSNRGTCEIDQCTYNGTVPCADPLGSDPDGCLSEILLDYNTSNPLDIFMADVQCCNCSEPWTGGICQRENTPPAPSPSGAEDLSLGVILTISFLGFIVGAALVGVLLYFKFRKQARDALVKINRRLRMPPPQTEATIVFTDVEASTKLWEWDPPGMKESLEISFKVMRALLKKYYGYESNTEGDAICVVFHTEVDAVAWALDVQQALLYPEKLVGKDWPPNLLKNPLTCPIEHNGKVIFRGLRVRIGIHSGRKEDVTSVPSEETSNGRMSFFGEALSLSCFRAQGKKGNHDITSSNEECLDKSNDQDVCGRRQDHPTKMEEQAQGSVKNTVPQNGISQSSNSENAQFSSSIHLTSGRTRYIGPAVELAKKISDVPAGGQIFLTGSTLGNVGLQQLEQAVQIVHMGEHQLSEGKPPVELIQILPADLLGRLYYFAPPRHTVPVAPSYFEAPGVISKGLNKDDFSYDEVVIVFMFLTGIESLNQWDRNATEAATARATHCIRLHLRKHNGYEVEETEGNMMLSFRLLSEAALFATTVQEELIHLDWNSELLMQPAACEVWESPATFKSASLCLFRGLRYKTGIASGVPTSIEPHASTGRAAYFGPVTSRAARVAALAAGGQVLSFSKQWQDCIAANHSLKRLIRSVELGAYRLKGIDSSQPLTQLSTPQLAARPFEPLGGTLDRLFAKFVPSSLSQGLSVTRRFGKAAQGSSNLSGSIPENETLSAPRQSQLQSSFGLDEPSQTVELSNMAFSEVSRASSLAYEVLLARNEFLEAELERWKALHNEQRTTQ